MEFELSLNGGSTWIPWSEKNNGETIASLLREVNVNEVVLRFVDGSELIYRNKKEG